MTTGEALIGLDVGTTETKAVLFSLSGDELDLARGSYRLSTPQPGWAELDPEAIWQTVVAALQAIAGRAAPGTRIRALALATQGGTLVAGRADGTPTGPAITWLDRRSQELAGRWQAEGVSDRVRQISGWWPQPGLPLLSIGWLRQHRPEVLAASERFFSVNDFVAGRLTGHPTTDASMAGEMLLTDIATGRWSDELCRLVGIGRERLSPILPPTASLGSIRPEVARLTGLPTETMVINGGQDHACEALALGLTPAGAGLLACGTAWVINAVVASPAVDALPPSMDLNHHLVPGSWLASQFLGGLGACPEWWLDQCRPAAPITRDAAWARFDAALSSTAPGCGGLIYLPQTGARQARPALPHGGLFGLRLDHSWADVGRAMLEAAAYELRWALEGLDAAGLALEQMWMIGGAARNPLWPQIVADVTGRSILLSPYSHGPALGAALLAGVGLGIWESVEAARARFRVPPRRVGPDGSLAPAYDRPYAAYRRLVEELAA